MASGGTSASEQSSSGTSRTAPWAAQAPYLRDLYSHAAQIFGQGPYQYGPGRVEGADPFQQQAWGQIRDRASAGSPLLEQAKDQMQSTLRGDYMDPDRSPWLSKMYDAAAQPMTRNFMTSGMPTLNTQFAGAGRTQQDAGGTAQTAAAARAQGELARGLGNLSANLYGGHADRERNRQMSAGQMAPGLAQSDYFDAQMLGGAGGQRQQFAQRALDDIVQRFNFNQMANQMKLQEFIGNIGQPIVTSASEQASRGRSKAFNVSGLWG